MTGTQHTDGAVKAAARIIDFLGITRINGIHTTVANIIIEETAAEGDRLREVNAEMRRALENFVGSTWMVTHTHNGDWEGVVDDARTALAKEEPDAKAN